MSTSKTQFVLSISTTEDSLELVGGKGRSLARMATAGFAVPGGFLVTTHAYRQYVAENDLQSRILELAKPELKDGTVTFAKASDDIRQLFDGAEVSKELARAEDYGEIARRAIREMHRQVGDLVIDDQGLARRGLLARHLVMPNGLAGTREVMRFLAQVISQDTFVNVMPQYRPAGLAHRHESISRTLWVDEFEEALAIAREEGIRRFDRA